VASERRLVVAVLRAGLALAAALLTAGLALAVGEARLTSHPVALSQILPFLARGRPSGYLAAGVLVLVATPAVRVLVLAAGFARERDWRFAAVALAVAAILGLGVAVGRA
jgi:uncharacterized membrane protein